MSNDVKQFWDSIAEDWEIQTGHEGDRNRRLNSDPVLFELLGEVRGLTVLDAGCGTGYLSAKLNGMGAAVTAVDLSENMVGIARKKYPGITFRTDSCSTLLTQKDSSFDALISNYVLMDLHDLSGAVRSFFRVLKPGGIAVVVFSHPCFPMADSEDADNGDLLIRWPYPYFIQKKRVDPPWGHFTESFIRFHRPLSDYWRGFLNAGFLVTGFDEPHHQPDSGRPYSVAFRLKKPLTEP